MPKTVFTLYVHTDPPMDPNVPRVSTLRYHVESVDGVGAVAPVR